MKRSAILMILPVLIAGSIVFYLPFLMTIKLSLFKSNYIVTEFIGLNNYIKVFQNPVFIRILVNSLIYALFFVIVQTTTALFVTFVAMDMSTKWQSYIRFVAFIPTFTAGLIITTVWKWIYHPTVGLANYIIGLLGIEPVIWLGGRYIAIFSVAFSMILSLVGGNILILLSSEKGISRELYESAVMDGARNIQIKLRITLPLIMPTVLILMLLQLLMGFQMWETLYLMAPVQSANNLMYDIWDTAFASSKYGLGAAKAVVLMVVVSAISIIKRKLETKGEKD